MQDRQPKDDDVWEGARLTGVALVCAFVTAALVIVAGGALLTPPTEPAANPTARPIVVLASLP